GAWRERLWALAGAAGAAPAKAPPDVLHTVYTRLGRLCPLTPAHRAQLRARGLTDEQIARHGYASLPATGRSAIAKRLLADCADGILGHTPGLWLSTRGRTD